MIFHFQTHTHKASGVMSTTATDRTVASVCVVQLCFNFALPSTLVYRPALLLHAHILYHSLLSIPCLSGGDIALSLSIGVNLHLQHILKEWAIQV